VCQTPYQELPDIQALNPVAAFDVGCSDDVYSATQKMTSRDSVLTGSCYPLSLLVVLYFNRWELHVYD
jgi:hypothetical protein